MVTNIGFGSQREVNLFRQAIKHRPVARLINSCEKGEFKGITLEEIESKEIQDEILAAKAKQIFQGMKDGYDKAIDTLKKSFKS